MKIRKIVNHNNINIYLTFTNKYTNFQKKINKKLNKEASVSFLQNVNNNFVDFKRKSENPNTRDGNLNTKETDVMLKLKIILTVFGCLTWKKFVNS